MHNFIVYDDEATEQMCYHPHKIKKISLCFCLTDRNTINCF